MEGKGRDGGDRATVAQSRAMTMSQPLDSARHAGDLALAAARAAPSGGRERDRDCFESETLARFEQSKSD